MARLSEASGSETTSSVPAPCPLAALAVLIPLLCQVAVVTGQDIMPDGNMSVSTSPAATDSALLATVGEMQWPELYVSIAPEQMPSPSLSWCPGTLKCAAVGDVSRKAPCSASVPCCMPDDVCVRRDGESFCGPEQSNAQGDSVQAEPIGVHICTAYKYCGNVALPGAAVSPVHGARMFSSSEHTMFAVTDVPAVVGAVHASAAPLWAHRATIASKQHDLQVPYLRWTFSAKCSRFFSPPLSPTATLQMLLFAGVSLQLNPIVAHCGSAAWSMMTRRATQFSCHGIRTTRVMNTTLADVPIAPRGQEQTHATPRPAAMVRSSWFCRV